MAKKEMRVLQINTVYGYGSTGKIAEGIHDCCIQNGDNCVTAHRFFEKKMTDSITVSSWLDCHIHNRLGRIFCIGGCLSAIKTRGFLKWLDSYKPEIIQLHNLHGNYINLPALFGYIKKHHIPVVWTLHDCWAFTGQCPYFDIAGCGKWKNGCHHCPQIHEYPNAFVDNTRMMWKLKRKWFTGVENMTIVTPSRWLADLVKQSYLKDYPVKVINNGIDLNVFKPVESNFRERHGIAQDKFVLLGVAFGWGKRKGLDVFIELSKRLDSRFQIVLVGTDEQTDSQLPENIISIHRTENQQELAEIYSAADLFVNPTREDNYPTVNMESIACGTPVLTFKTGGSPEIADESCGSVVDKDDIDAMEKEIIRICTVRPYSKEACLNRARVFDMYKRFEEYTELYENIAHCP